MNTICICPVWSDEDLIVEYSVYYNSNDEAEIEIFDVRFASSKSIALPEMFGCDNEDKWHKEIEEVVFEYLKEMEQ